VTRAWPGLRPARRVLANGLVALARASHDVPIVSISVGLDAGLLREPADTPGAAHFVTRVLDRGSLFHDAAELSDTLDSRGASLAIAAGRHQIAVSCTCLAEDFDAILGLVSEVVTTPTFPASEIETRRAHILTAIRQDEDNPFAVASDASLGALYPAGHPYGRPLMGTAASVASLCRDDLVSFHKARIAPGSSSVVVAGDVEAARAFDQIERCFGSWQRLAEPVPDTPPVQRLPERRVIRRTVRDKSQADLAYSMLGVPRFHSSYYAVWLMNHVLGEYGLGGRLGARIREREGRAYYAYSGFEAHTLEAPIVVRVGVNPADIDQALAAVDEEVARMAAEGPTADELQDAVRYLAGSIPRMFETSAGVAQFLQTVQYFELDLDYDRRLPDLLAAVSREAVSDAARRHLRPDAAAIAIAGPDWKPSGQRGGAE
jgi:zinc protease